MSLLGRAAFAARRADDVATRKSRVAARSSGMSLPRVAAKSTAATVLSLGLGALMSPPDALFTPLGSAEVAARMR
jgi:hypothetical protein